MTAEQVEPAQQPVTVTGDSQDTHEPWLTDRPCHSAQPLRHDHKVVAERNWGRCAIVRFIRDVEAAAPFDETPTRYQNGEQMRLWQCGRKGKAVDLRFWHTSLDVEDVHFIPEEAVEVIEILEDTPPC